MSAGFGVHGLWFAPVRLGKYPQFEIRVCSSGFRLRSRTDILVCLEMGQQDAVVPPFIRCLPPL